MGLKIYVQSKSGFLATLNPQQEAALQELATKTKDIPYVRDHPDGDAYLLRFLRATMASKARFIMFKVHILNFTLVISK